MGLNFILILFNMLLELKRLYKKQNYTIGDLYIDNQFFSNTLEDKDRGLTDNMDLSTIKSKKVYGETAIPTGTYTVDMKTVSPKFKGRSWAKPTGIVPRLLNVKGFDGVLIHPLNKASESLGCIGVGFNKIVGQIVDSVSTYKKLTKLLQEASNKGDKITIKIS